MAANRCLATSGYVGPLVARNTARPGMIGVAADPVAAALTLRLPTVGLPVPDHPPGPSSRSSTLWASGRPVRARAAPWLGTSQPEWSAREGGRDLRVPRNAPGPWHAPTAATAIGATPGPVMCPRQPLVPSRWTVSAPRSTWAPARPLHQIEITSPSGRARPTRRSEVTSQSLSPLSCQPLAVTSRAKLSTCRPDHRTRLRDTCVT